MTINGTGSIGMGDVTFESGMASSSYKQLKLGIGTIGDSGDSSGGNTYIANNVYSGASNDLKFRHAAAASYIGLTGGDLYFNTHDGGGASQHGTATLNTRMFIKENGNIGIRTTSPGATFDIGGGVYADPTLLIDSGSGGDPRLFFDTTGANRNAIINFFDQGSLIGGIHYVHNGDYIKFSVGSSNSRGRTEVYENHLRITDGTTSTYTTDQYLDFWSGNKQGSQQLDASSTSSSQVFRWKLFDNGNTLMELKSGGIYGAMNDTSDVALKENIVDITDGTTIIKALKPRIFDWKSLEDAPTDHYGGTGTGHAGFIAQEVETVFAKGVSGEEGSKGVKAMAILAHAVKAIQELETRIATLEG